MLAEPGLISLVVNAYAGRTPQETLRRGTFEKREKRSLLEVMVIGIAFALTYFLFLAIFVGGPIVVLAAAFGH
jgi:hypothetical protein